MAPIRLKAGSTRALLPIKAFLKELKSMAKAGIGDVQNLLKSFKSNIKSLDDIVTTLPVTKNKYGFIELAENSVGNVNKVIREANLAELVRLSGKNVPYTSADVVSFKTLVSDTPELSFKELSDLVTANKKSYPQLDLKTADFPTMSKTASANITRIENNLLKYVSTGGKVLLTLGVIYVGVDWLTKTTEQRKGCFMMTTINGVTTSCKVEAYSCIGSGGELCSSALPYYNTTLVLMKIATLPDDNELKIKVAQAAGVQVSALNSSLASVIDTKYSEVSQIIESETNKPTFSICSITHPDVENGVVPACRMCSPSDNPISTTYIDGNQYPDNITFTCSINPSILDVVTDAAKSTGKNLLAGISTTLSTILKPLLIVAAVILVIIILVSIGVKLLKGRGGGGGGTNEIRYAPLT
ncbi:odv-e56 [Oryctes rhinoceros nudivirus]|uniref:Odv-e56 n=1 Tax=Oryctes rhinoceros nudivirus TaxID=92521 RepID=A0A7D3QKK5_9VIRU|nr:odv-e56 [Oryctes rhinoceros nudivirus]ACH96245.1 odv-e56 [Oryctes rhinoceros nudivirus]QKE59577.1 odv-e56 [Oryctes rhinoceros nudivirus]UBO76524.1 ODV-e56 [Oryctes rhinoceros nudivirus]WDA64550.1 ODV-e56 [Oryctes rhinoceros nudivirus]